MAEAGRGRGSHLPQLDVHVRGHGRVGIEQRRDHMHSELAVLGGCLERVLAQGTQLLDLLGAVGAFLAARLDELGQLLVDNLLRELLLLLALLVVELLRLVCLSTRLLLRVRLNKPE